jgi:hypothetical protein
MRTLKLALGCVLAACGSVPSDNPDAPVTPGADADPNAPDAAPGPDAAPPRCSPTAPFGTPTLVPNLNTPFDEVALALADDERTLFMSRVNTGDPAAIMTAERASTDVAFGAPGTTGMAAVNGVTGSEYAPTLTASGLELYFHRQDTAGIGPRVSVRGEPGGPPPTDVAVTREGEPLLDGLSPVISADGQTLYWLDFSNFTLRGAPRTGGPEAFGGDDRESTFAMNAAVLSADELTLYYQLSSTEDDIRVTTRTATTGVFGPGVAVDNVNSPDDDAPVYLTEDGCVLYLRSDRAGGLGGFDIWEARRGS